MPPAWWIGKNLTYSDLSELDVNGVELIRTTIGFLVYGDQCDTYQYHMFSHFREFNVRTKIIALLTIAYNRMNNLDFRVIGDERYDRIVNLAGINIEAVLDDFENAYNIQIMEPSIANNISHVAYLQGLGVNMTISNVAAFLKLCDGIELVSKIYRGDTYASDSDAHLFPPISFNPKDTELFMRSIRWYCDDRSEFVREYYEEALKHVEDKDTYKQWYEELMIKRAPRAIAYWAQKEPGLLLTTIIEYKELTIAKLEETLKRRIKANRQLLIIQAGEEPMNAETTIGDPWYMHSNIYLVKSNGRVYALTSQEILHANSNVYTQEPIFIHNLQSTLALQREWENILHLDVNCDPFAD